MRALANDLTIRNGSEILDVVVLVCNYITVGHNSVPHTTVCEVFAVAVLDAVGNWSKYLFDSGYYLKDLGLTTCDLDVVNVLAQDSGELVTVMLYLLLSIEGGRGQAELGRLSYLRKLKCESARCINTSSARFDALQYFKVLVKILVTRDLS